MDIVVDTSVIIAVIASEPQREVLIERTRGANLLAPYSVHWEIGNAFSAMIRRKRVTLAEALKAIEVYQRIPIRYVEVEIEEALKVAGGAGVCGETGGGRGVAVGGGRGGFGVERGGDRGGGAGGEEAVRVGISRLTGA